MNKIIRISAASMSLKYLLKGQLAFLNQYYQVIGVSSPDKLLYEVSKNEGIEVKGIQIKRQISLISDIKSLLEIYRYFKNENPQIIHSITPKAGLISMIAGYFAGVPIRIHTFTGLIFPERKGLLHCLLKNTDRLTCIFATHIIPEGQGVKKDLLKYKITTKPLNVIANGNVNGIDLNYFSPQCINHAINNKIRNELNLTSANTIFCYVGRLVKDKGINELIEAYKNVHLKHPSTILLLVGPFEEKLDPIHPNNVKVIFSHPGIRYVGFQNDIRPYLAISNIFVFPSYREGFPNVVMQAGAMGLPSIVTNINGSNEIILDQVNGIIIPPKDAISLEKAMIELLEKKEKSKQLALNSRQLIVERYEQKMVWHLIKEEYDKQLKDAKIN